ncbi:MAG: glycerol-3-phosphate dehydrogenase [Alphaproteobacteria bacterium]|nr:glycerol-3-phosphate dehydrogenase [Alphaproteobacteria bacterium]
MADACDLLVVGGGINGCGIARDAAGRGLDVALVEKGDLAGATSSASSKLIHGGLRYLEQGHFRLVREALAERARLMACAPHLVRPLRLVLPIVPGLRPAPLLRFGLFLYDRMAAGDLPGAAALDLARAAEGRALLPELKRGLVFSDAATDDARLTVLVARDAAERGARILPRTELLEARREGALWTARLRGAGGGEQSLTARVLVNAAGPWVGEVGRRTAAAPRGRVRLVKGSHIVLPRLYAGPHAYLLQERDGRVLFVLPFEEAFTLVGTTEVALAGSPEEAAISPEETDYLLAGLARLLRAAPTREDIVWSFAGVRPLYDDGSANVTAMNRDYVFDIDAPEGLAPLLTVYGGKLTTFRRLAEAALGRLASHLPMGPDWTARATLPGGDIPQADFPAFVREMAARYPFLPEAECRRLSRSYGTRMTRFLGPARAAADLGRRLVAGLGEAELEHLVREEWAMTTDDVLWRRTKLGLVAGAAERAAVAEALERLRVPPTKED